MIRKIDYVKTAENIAKRMIEEGDGHGNGYTAETMLSDILAWGFRGLANWKNEEEIAEYIRKDLGFTDLRNIIVYVNIKESQ
jgi:hypothetical protein